MTDTAPLPYGVPPDGFRLPPDTRVGGVRLQVADLSRSVGYYEHVIGLRTISRATDRADLAPTGDTRVLIELHARAGARPVSRRGALGLFHFAILLPDRPALGRFLRHALEVRVVSGTADHAVSEAIYLSDPDGHGIEVYADRPRRTWRVQRDRELHMTTDALDVGGVMAEAGDRQWDAAPLGTRMGHVHLHVGSLDRAEAFYHRALGFDKIVWTYPGALFLSAGGYHHHLGTNTWSRGAVPADDNARLLSWDLEVANPEAAAESVARAGYPVTERDTMWSVADPWGTVLRLRRLR